MDNVEKVSKSGVVMKATIKKYVAMLDEICREMLDLRRQIHPVHGLCHEETSKLKHLIVGRKNATYKSFKWSLKSKNHFSPLVWQVARQIFSLINMDLSFQFAS